LDTTKAGEEASRLIEAICADWRLLVNFAMLMRKQVRKEQVGAKVRKVGSSLFGVGNG